MSGSVSVPEKTLEHWSSQYLMYRYRSLAALWWPASGEDIDLRWFPNMPGKAIQLELKTTTITRDDLHKVSVDLGQLWEYSQRPLGRQPFYAFPNPDWKGSLTDAAVAAGQPVTDLGFRRSGRAWWFGDWMIVLTTRQVADVLSVDLTKHGCPARGFKRTLVRFDLSHSLTDPKVTWGPDVAAPTHVRWPDLWTELDVCGQPGWPQLIRVPARLISPRHRRRYTHSDVAELLKAAAQLITTGDWHDGRQLVTLAPDLDGGFEVDLEPLPIHGMPEPHEFPDHRQAVFLVAGARAARQ